MFGRTSNLQAAKQATALYEGNDPDPFGSEDAARYSTSGLKQVTAYEDHPSVFTSFTPYLLSDLSAKMDCKNMTPPIQTI